MSCCRSPPLVTVTTIGEAVPEGCTCHGPYGPTGCDHSGCIASTVSSYRALLLLSGIASPERSNAPSTVASSEPNRSKGCPLPSLGPFTEFPAYPRNRNPETEAAPYAREGKPITGSTQRATTLIPCIG